MSFLIFALGALLSLGGAASIYSGYGIVEVERGWTAVIAGATALSAGIVTIGIAFILRCLVRLQAFLEAEKGFLPLLSELALHQARHNLRPANPQAPGVEGSAGAADPIGSVAIAATPSRPRSEIATGPEGYAGAAQSARLFREAAASATILSPASSMAPPVAIGDIRRVAAEFEPVPSNEPDAETEPDFGAIQGAAADAPDIPDTLAIAGAGVPLIGPESEGGAGKGPGFDESHADLAADRGEGDKIGVEAEWKPTGMGDDETKGVGVPDEESAAEWDSPRVTARYEADGTSYVMYADGSIDAHSERGAFHFESLAELKAFMEARG